MADGKLPAMQWYPGDWRKDPGVQGLDLEARGAWRECIDMMWESPERGRLVFANGRPMPDVAIASNLGIDEAHWKQIRSKLLDYGVASEDHEGVLYNRRMVRKEASNRRLSKVRAEAGRKGGTISKRKAKKAASSSSSSSEQITEQRTDVSAIATTSGAGAVDRNDKPVANGPATQPAAEPPLTILQRFMPVLRDAGFNADDTDGSILKRLNEQSRPWTDIEAAILGLAYGRDHGMLQESHGIEPGQKLSLRLLYAKNKTTYPPLWTDAIDVWYPAWLRSQDTEAAAAGRKSEWGVRL
jgi:hypothetical protein